MKKIIILLLFFLFLGCVTSENQNNDTIQVNFTGENQTVIGECTSLESEGIIILENATQELIQNNTEQNLTLEGLEFGENYILVLDDLSLDKPEPCAIVSIYNLESEENLQQAKICPGEEYYWTSPEGHKFRIVVIETAAGYSYGAGWANIIIYG